MNSSHPLRDRIAADLENNIRRELPVLPSVSTSGRILKFTPVETEKSYQTKSSESSITRFCKTLRLIEYERLRQREHLQVTYMPSYASRFYPSILLISSPNLYD